MSNRAGYLSASQLKGAAVRNVAMRKIFNVPEAVRIDRAEPVVVGVEVEDAAASTVTITEHVLSFFVALSSTVGTCL